MTRLRPLGLTLAVMLFALAATANSGGYRYGVSDQAFYATSVIKTLHPSLYPRDTPLLEAESHLMWSDELIAGVSRTLGVDLPPLYFALYLATLATMFAAAIALGRAAGFSWWAIAGLLVLLTFKHRIARTAANTLEGYMHPRVLAFALGMFAFAAVLRGRYLVAVAWTLVAAVWHPTTAFWFLVVVGTATFVGRPQWRRACYLLAGAGVAVSVWAVTTGPLAGRLIVMDPAWLTVLAVKDYLFPHQWPLEAWLLNLAYPVVIVAIYRRRVARGVAAIGETSLVIGLTALLVIFAISVPLTMMHLALAVQMQVTRIFWLLDVVTAAYVAWWIFEDVLASRRLRQLALVLLAGASIARGAYLLAGDRTLVTVNLPASPWIDAMAWLKQRPASWYVLADPGHAWKYGISVRLAAEKDTLVESSKDSALAMYDRKIAMQVSDRQTALRDFDRLNAADARALAAHYGLDVIVVEATHPLDLPVLYTNSQFVIYDLK